MLNQKKRQVGREIKSRLPLVSPSLISKSLGIPKRSLFNPKPKQNEAELIFRDQILKVLEVNPSYGHRRIALALNTSKKRTRRVMKLYGIKPYKRKARWTKKRDLGNPPSKYQNLIKGYCSLNPNVVFAGDFTRLMWNGKVIYLATFMDLFTREIVGWSVSVRHTTEFIIEAYLDAVKTVGRSAIVHPTRDPNIIRKTIPPLWMDSESKSVCQPKVPPGKTDIKNPGTTTLKPT